MQFPHALMKSAVQRGNLDALQMLLSEFPARPISSACAESCYSHAVSSGNVPILKTLLADKRTLPPPTYLPYLAAVSTSAHVYETLITLLADPAVVDADPEMTVFAARSEDNDVALQALYDHGGVYIHLVDRDAGRARSHWLPVRRMWVAALTASMGSDN